MSQGDLYISFGFDENPNYFSSPSLNSVLSEHEEDDANVDEIANEPIILEAIVHCEPSEPISVWRKYWSSFTLTKLGQLINFMK